MHSDHSISINFAHKLRLWKPPSKSSCPFVSWLKVGTQTKDQYKRIWSQCLARSGLYSLVRIFSFFFSLSTVLEGTVMIFCTSKWYLRLVHGHTNLWNMFVSLVGQILWLFYAVWAVRHLTRVLSWFVFQPSSWFCRSHERPPSWKAALKVFWLILFYVPFDFSNLRTISIWKICSIRDNWKTRF